MPSIADTAAQVAAAGAPVLFLDTCSILDVIRAPVRGLAGCVEAASELLAMSAATPRACTLAVGSFVPGEWSTHAQPVLESLTTHLEKMDKQAEHFHGLCGHLGLALGFSVPEYGASNLAARLHDLSRQLLGAALVLDTQQATRDRAVDRVAVTKRRPCRKGGELKDCIIFEECLEVCHQARVAGLVGKLIFCSSNTDDYCAPGFTPHPDVATDCRAVGLQFTTTLPWAVSELKK